MGWPLVVLTAVWGTQAVAQRSRAHRAFPRERVEARPFADPPPPTTQLRPANDGIIHWNTPNKDGNLGGPGTGGGGGGGG